MPTRLLPLVAVLGLAACVEEVSMPEPDEGAALFAANCAQCHGATGKGDGPWAAGMRPPPSDLTQLSGPDGFPRARGPVGDRRLRPQRPAGQGDAGIRCAAGGRDGAGRCGRRRADAHAAAARGAAGLSGEHPGGMSAAAGQGRQAAAIAGPPIATRRCARLYLRHAFGVAGTAILLIASASGGHPNDGRHKSLPRPGRIAAPGPGEPLARLYGPACAHPPRSRSSSSSAADSPSASSPFSR